MALIDFTNIQYLKINPDQASRPNGADVTAGTFPICSVS